MSLDIAQIPQHSVDVSIGRWDIVWMNMAVAPKLRVTWFLFAVFCALILGSYLSIEPFPQDGVLVTAFVLAFAILTSIGFVLFLFVSSLIGAMAATGRAGVLGKHRYTLREDGIFEATDANESLHKWAGLHSVIRTRKWLFVRINHYLFHMIPARAFEGPAEFQDFAEALEARFEAARASA